jgi:ABC-type microcin C transport system duplicated ATPase subunit YejF
MKIINHQPPRKFTVGKSRKCEINHCASIELAKDEQITFISESGSEYDVVQKDWGLYATPSLNGRLVDNQLHAVLVRNAKTKRYFIILVYEDCYSSFNEYLATQEMEVVYWLDSDDQLESLRSAIAD